MEFFAEAVFDTATQAVETAQELMKLASEDREKINELGRVSGSALQIHRALPERPIASPNWIKDKTQLSPATIRSCLEHLKRTGIVKELTGRKRNRLYGYSRYIEVMNQGTDLPF